MTIIVSQRTTHLISCNGVVVVIDHEPVGGDSVLFERVGDTVVVAYLAQDSDTTTEELIGDCMGNIYSFHKHAAKEDHKAGLAAIGRDEEGIRRDDIVPDIDAVQLDCYQHGNVMWSISGTGMQDRFDTARGAGVWMPDKCLREQIDSDVAKSQLGHVVPEPIAYRRERAEHYCKQFLAIYNASANGEVYRCIVQVYHLSESLGGPPLWLEDYDEGQEAWGFAGMEEAMQALKEEYFQPVVSAFRSEEPA
jgi:hypothetical protein